MWNEKQLDDMSGLQPQTKTLLILPKQASSKTFITVVFGAKQQRSASRGFACQMKKVNVRSHIPERFIQHLMKLSMMAFSVNSKGRTFISGKPIDDSLRGSIIDMIIADGGDASSRFFPGNLLRCCESKSTNNEVRTQRNVTMCVCLFHLTSKAT